MTQLNLFLVDRPEQQDTKFELGDYVTGFDPRGDAHAGYICATGLKFLYLSAIPRCGKLNSGNELGEYGKLPYTVITLATARRINPSSVVEGLADT